MLTTLAKSAVVLLSGGLDSATVLAMAHQRGFAITALSFDYGQRHAREIACAAALARHYRVARHETMKIDLRAFGGSALTADIPVPKDTLDQPNAKPKTQNPKPGEVETRNLKPGGGETRNSSIPITYVPARNTIFLSLALGLAEVTGAFDIFLGVNAIDYSGYPDCRPEFIAAFERTANLATKAGVEAAADNAPAAPTRNAGVSPATPTGNAGILPAPGFHIHAPLIQMSKAQIIREGLRLAVPYQLTHSCYDPTAEGKACGHCDSCLLRLAGFKEAGVQDPIPYA